MSVWVVEVLVSEPDEDEPENEIWTPRAVRLTARGAAKLCERWNEEENSYRVREYVKERKH